MVPKFQKLANVNGFSPFQLVFGQNPKLPSTFVDKPPSLVQYGTSKILTNNLTAQHKARQTFTLSESSEKIGSTLKNNVQTSADSVYFKKINEKRWMGPGKVYGQDGQQVLAITMQESIHPDCHCLEILPII